mgnify:CR=1 FL=1
MAAVVNDKSIPVGAGGVRNLLLVAPESPRWGTEQPPPKLGLEEVRSSESLPVLGWGGKGGLVRLRLESQTFPGTRNTIKRELPLSQGNSSPLRLMLLGVFPKGC